MDNEAHSSTAETPGQSQPSEPSAPGPTDPPVSPVRSTISNDDTGSMATILEDVDEIWSDAQEVTEAAEEVDVVQQEIAESVNADNIGSTNVPSSRLGLDPDLVQLKVVTEENNKGESEVMTVEEPPSAISTSSDPAPAQVELATARPPTLEVPSMPTSPTPSASTHAGASLEAPSSTSSTRPVSPSPTQSSHGLSRRQSRRRSAIDGRSTNRFSSLLSNLIHRRPERDHPPGSSGRPSAREDGEPAHSKGDESSRASSPLRAARPVTPPPALPAPSLQELGLSLTAVTSILTPSHFSTPPTSGTFMKPHYLLLCHTQGLDVLPLVAPPAPQPYALVRRVSFKSVVVMEEKGVLVAIAGRRDGVRVYALEEVKKAVEWRVDVEIRREKERLKREEAKRGTSNVDKVFGELKSGTPMHEKPNKSSLAESPTTPTPATPKNKRRKSSVGTATTTGSAPPRPRPPVTGRKLRRASSRDTPSAHRISDPPPYQAPTSSRPGLENQSSVISVTQTRSRSGSVQNVLAGTSARRRSVVSVPRDDEKGDWEHHSSDDEAINMATAGPSGSAALDERTSSMASGGPSATHPSPVEGGQAVTPLDIPNLAESRRLSQTSASPTMTRRSSRPAQLDLTLSRTPTVTGNASRPPPSPTPSVWTLRQALAAAPSEEDRSRTITSDVDGEDDDDDGDGDAEPISFAQALMESRLPGLPPPGSQRPQEPILINSRDTTEPQSPVESASTENVDINPASRRARRRWSVLDGVFSQSGSTEFIRPDNSSNRSRTIRESLSERPSIGLIRMNSADANSTVRRLSRGHASATSLSRPSTARSMPAAPSPSPSAPSTPSQRRFLPRIITNALHSRRSDDQPSPGAKSLPGESTKSSNAGAPLPPAPKLEYVKLPGTKGAVMIKAVETAKKSFLAILCGENGEKVELFAGTYRTTLGLSRTFILPDSPRSLELQLQGDDLVEVFLVFAQNVFGLEPATVRVREVRVGRAERRAARRRARENRAEELASTEVNGPSLGDGDATDANVSVGVTLTTSTTSQTFDESVSTLPPMSRQASESNLNASDSTQPPPNTTQSEELAALATAHVAPYTTFQQLSFAPQFPLATIADECVIPPTYQTFLEYRAQYEPEPDGANNLDLANVQFSPPGLPIPLALPPSKWYYRDPKGVVQGPWKASLMQTWYKDGLLPPDLPVRREEDEDYILLKDLRAQSVDPAHPFRPPPPPLKNFSLPSEPVRPLLDPISLLTQQRRYGPPALFFTSRGGHSTTVVDARGRSVLQGRLHWSIDEEEDFSVYGNRLGDVKRLEAFDIGDTAVIAAVRQGGLEVTNVADALMGPGDMSRPALPNFKPHQSTVSRRGPFVWRVGAPLAAFAAGPVSSDKVLLSTPSGKKQGGLGIGKSSAKNELALGNADDYEGRQHEELLFLGRIGETVYFCERSNGSFRILRLCPNTASTTSLL